MHKKRGEICSTARLSQSHIGLVTGAELTVGGLLVCIFVIYKRLAKDSVTS
jgi:hypothetical protein